MSILKTLMKIMNNVSNHRPADMIRGWVPVVNLTITLLPHDFSSPPTLLVHNIHVYGSIVFSLSLCKQAQRVNSETHGRL